MKAGECDARIGAVLREARREAGLTQSQLGDQTGLGRKAIGQIERGDKRLQVGAFVDIILALDVDQDKFLKKVMTAYGDASGA